MFNSLAGSWALLKARFRPQVSLSGLLLAAFAALPLPALAQPVSLGEFRLNGVFFHPRLEYSEADKAQFQADLWSAQASWSLPPSLSVHLLAGSSSLTQPMSFYPAPVRQGLDLAELYAQYSWGASQVQLGRVKLPVGFWGSKPATDQSLARSILYQKGLVNLRDQGLAFETSLGAFRNRWVIHSGESGPDRDNQWAFSGQWEFLDSEGFFMGLSGQVGRVAALETAGENPRLAGHLWEQGVRHRLGNFYFGWMKPSSLVLLEGFWGGWESGDLERSFTSLMGEVTRFVSARVPVYFRLDRWNVKNWQQERSETQWSLGAGLSSPYQNSLFLFVLRLEQPDGEPANHSALLSWRLRSKSPHPLTRTL